MQFQQQHLYCNSGITNISCVCIRPIPFTFYNFLLFKNQNTNYPFFFFLQFFFFLSRACSLSSHLRRVQKTAFLMDVQRHRVCILNFTFSKKICKKSYRTITADIRFRAAQQWGKVQRFFNVRKQSTSSKLFIYLVGLSSCLPSTWRF